MSDLWDDLKAADAALADARLAGGDDGPHGLQALAVEDALVRSAGGVTPELELRAARWALKLADEAMESIAGPLFGLLATGPDADLVEMLDLAVQRVQRWSPARPGTADLEGAVKRVRDARASTSGGDRLVWNGFLVMLHLVFGRATQRMLPSMVSAGTPPRDRRESPLIAAIGALHVIARDAEAATRQ